MYQFDFGRLENLKDDLPRIQDLKDRFRHTYIIGSTGTGKTSLMLRMALHDIKQGMACIFIDPKGEHARQLYSLIPDKSRVTYFSYENPTITINPLRKDGYLLNDLIDEFIEILDLLIRHTSPTNPSASENMKELLSEAIKAIEEKDRNIDFLYEFLRFEDFRKEYFGKKIPKYWQAATSKGKKGGSSEEAQTARRLSIRLSKFVQDERLKRVINGKNELDIAKIAKNKEIIIVDTSMMSDEKRIYITALFSFAVKSYLVFQKQEKYYPLMFYIDEFWMGVNESFEHLLKTARSYKVGFTLAHQDIASFPSRNTLKCILGNCNTKIAFFPAGADEARLMAELYGIPQKELRNLDKYYAWVRIFNKNSLVKTFPPPVPDHIEDPPINKMQLKPGKTLMTEAMETAQPSKKRETECNFLKDCWFPC